MLVVHGFLGGGRLSLWAEDSDRRVKSTSQALRSARRHPFASSAEGLVGLHAGKADQAVLLLPSLRSAPLDSPELVRATPRPAPRSTPGLLAWTVPVVTFDAPAALETLAERVDGVRYGASVHYLAELALFARELAERGRVLPTLSGDGDRGGALARWRPVLRGADLTTAHGFVTALPPVCRASQDRESPQSLVIDGLAALVDAAVRQSLPPDLDLAPPRRGRRPKRLPLVEAWLAALSGPDGHLDADPDEVAALVSLLQPWDEAGDVPTGPARATFRLSEVAADGPGDQTLWAEQVDQRAAQLDRGVAAAAGEASRWHVEFLLQSTADPSLLVPAAQVWADEASLRPWLADAQESLLAELGRASRVCPDLAPGLRQATPCGLELDADGAYRFLAVGAPALGDAGFGVLLPSWWDHRGRLGLKLSASTPVDGVVTKASRFGKDQLVEFRWQLAVGDEALTDDEMAALAATKAPLIRLRGQWVVVDPDQLQRGLAFLEKGASGTKTAAELLGLAASHPDDVDAPLPVTGIEADGWLGDLLAGTAERTLQPVPLPDGFQAVLRPYQERGLAWLAFLSSLGLGACLADDMGLGKTVQLLALEAAHRHDDPTARPTLLLCPMSLVGNWLREAARFAPRLRVYAHHGPGRQHGDELHRTLSDTDLVVTTYATSARDNDELAAIAWQRVVLDEAQAIKNSLSRSAKAVRRLQADHRVALTGTPVENRLAELWSIMDFCNPGMLGSPELFRTRYAIPVERHGLTEPARVLRAITRPYVLRRLKTDPSIVDDLPEKIEIKQYCHLTTEQASLYQSVVDEMMQRIERTKGIERRGNVLAAMAKLKQVCNHPALLMHDRSPIGQRSGKVTRLEELLEEILAEGDKALLFTQYTEFAEMLLPHLVARFGTDVAYLHGGTPRARRDELVARFQSDGGPPIFLLSLKAGGTGLNLTAANHVIHIDRWWNPAVEDQATDRAFRIGQQRNVQVRKFVCTGTLEERIDEMIEDKKALADLVVRDGEGWLTELSTGELRSVFALSEGAVGE